MEFSLAFPMEFIIALRFNLTRIKYLSRESVRRLTRILQFDTKWRRYEKWVFLRILKNIEIAAYIGGVSISSTTCIQSNILPGMM